MTRDLPWWDDNGVLAYSALCWRRNIAAALRHAWRTR